ncbi:MAG: hypothetical protein U1F43_39290, partial [Myxococcota bacterium]
MPTDDDKPTATEPAKTETDKVASPGATAAAAAPDKVDAVATKWLKEGFGFREGADGTLHLPEQGERGDVAARAEQFLEGFARTVAEASPVGPGEARKPEDVPDAGQAVVRFLSKMGGAVSDALQGYLRRNALDPQHPERPVVVDGQFLMRHGVPVVAEIVQSLGTAFEAPRTGAPAPSPAAASEPGATKTGEKVQVEIELPKLLKQLVEAFPSGAKVATAPAPAA